MIVRNVWRCDRMNDRPSSANARPNQRQDAENLNCDLFGFHHHSVPGFGTIVIGLHSTDNWLPSIRHGQNSTSY